MIDIIVVILSAPQQRPHLSARLYPSTSSTSLRISRSSAARSRRSAMAAAV
jgi:hypothetical protein